MKSVLCIYIQSSFTQIALNTITLNTPYLIVKCGGGAITLWNGTNCCGVLEENLLKDLNSDGGSSNTKHIARDTTEWF